MAKSEIRVPATTWSLVTILNTILRDHMNLKICGDPCLTFEHVADWDIFDKQPDPKAGEGDWQEWESSFYEPLHTMSVYLACGYCPAFGVGTDPGNAKRLELRIRCERSEWVGASLSYWEFQIWIKLPDSSIRRHAYQCHLGYGDERDICVIDTDKMPLDPPRKIAFWRQQKSKQQLKQH